ncbi:MAG: hypothetical protein A2X49_01465 [Lentisphaerae bacterium GWF2_52_8]|nr:MAG: hypothetical protein A2X49_01465 [Lentisphaerae bacterium GWF2_52_8]
MQNLMHPLALEGAWRLVAGLVLGGVFGFIVVKSSMAWRKTLAEQLALRDSRFLKIFFFSLVIGVPLFYFLRQWGLLEFNCRPVNFWGAACGGIVCGLGLAICREIPETAIASLSSGRFYSLWVLAGMLLAMPCVKIVSRYLAKTVWAWPAPVEYYRRLDGYLSPSSAVLWVAGLALVMTLFLHFTLSSDSDGSGD